MSDAEALSGVGSRVGGIEIAALPRKWSRLWRQAFAAFADRALGHVDAEMVRELQAGSTQFDLGQLREPMKFLLADALDEVGRLVAYWRVLAGDEPHQVKCSLNLQSREVVQEDDALSEALTDEEVIDALGECLRHAYPLGRLAPLLGAVQSIGSQTTTTD